MGWYSSLSKDPSSTFPVTWEHDTEIQEQYLTVNN